MRQLEGKVAIITGAGSGIGRAAMALFLAEGAKVVGSDRSARRMQETAGLVSEHEFDFVAVSGDAAEESHVAELVALAVSRFGRLDIPWANAGVGGTAVPIDMMEAAAFMETLRINLLGPMLLIKHAAPHLRKQKSGSVLVTASIAGQRARSGPIDYSASKAGVINLVQNCATSLGQDGVRVNAICPAGAQTGMTARIFDMLSAAHGHNPIATMNPMGRVGSAEDMARTGLFLASDAASYINGQFINVCGGLSASHPVAPELPYP